jgi:exosortase D (VPLPA-CTERM-specific)
MNAFRIGMIGVLVNSYGIGHAEGFLHYFEGWVIFGACIGLLFLLAVLMQRLQKNPAKLADTLDIDFGGLGEQAARIITIPLSAALIASAGLTSVVAAAYLAAPEREIVRTDREPFGFFPISLGDWDSTTSPLEPSIEQVLAADDYIQATFQAPGEAAPVGFFSAFYHKQTEGSGIHSPEVCLPVGGWEMFDIKTITVDLEADTGWAPFETNRAIIQKGLSQQLVYYWFEQRGKRMTNDFNVKMVTVMDSLRTGRSDGALVRFTTPVAKGETLEQADARIKRLMMETLPQLPRFLPN